MDVIPGLQEHFASSILPRNFDYFIGSVHFVGNDPHTGQPWEFDNEANFDRGVNDWYANDTRRLVEDFYALERQVPGFIPGIVIAGHMDRIKRFNYGERYFSEDAPWYREAVEETLRVYAGTDIIVELNTAGWRTPTGAAYPSAWITYRCRELGIRMTINTDAHAPNLLAADHDRAIAQLRASGYGEMWVRRDGAWVAEPLPE